ncbi:hypothetical protein CU098_002215 [Rhizopus stolonifer]|uniref:C2H2-type domain-containing protein n=1 Tax=Rhizopus stolonifer TaxID=4846 RepID=A0A367JZ05_RHIST|nr:hypothetical protein CU098_002215 [Rhizopus stolonifer]
MFTIENSLNVDHEPVFLAEPKRKDSGVFMEEIEMKSVRLPRLSTIIESIPFENVLLQKPRVTPFRCKHLDPATGRVCCQAFRRSYDLSRHQMIHLKNRPFFQCSDCDKKFTRLDALRRHQRIQRHNLL